MIDGRHDDVGDGVLSTSFGRTSDLFRSRLQSEGNAEIYVFAASVETSGMPEMLACSRTTVAMHSNGINRVRQSNRRRLIER